MIKLSISSICCDIRPYEKGVLYIAFNEAFVKEMLNSARSVKQHNPEMVIAAMTNFDLSNDCDDIDILIPIEPNHIRSKVDFISLTPFRKTLYLDSDTIINSDISDVFELLDRYDIAGVHDFARKREKYANLVPEYASIPYSFSEINGGVMCFRVSAETLKFFDMWKHYFYKYFKHTNGWDQVSLRVSLWESCVKLIHLPIEYNVRGIDNREKVDLPHIRKENGEKHMAPRIFHMHVDRNIHNNVYSVSYDDAVKYCKERHYRY